MRRSPPLLLAGGVSAAAAAAALLLPWWRAAVAPVLLVAGPSVALAPETATGWQVLGLLRAGLVVGLAVVAVVGSRAGGPSRGRSWRPRGVWRSRPASARCSTAPARLDRGSGCWGEGHPRDVRGLAVRNQDAYALWRLPGAAAVLADLPATPAGCVAAPPAAGPPVSLVPVGETAGDPLGAPLDTSGRWASDRLGTGAIVAVTPDGRRAPLGVRDGDGGVGPVVPDGSGGVWWLEAGDGRSTLVHGCPGVAEHRFPAVEIPGTGASLLTDLGGRPPLAGTTAGAFRIDGGSAERVVDGRVDGGAVRADGRGWVLVGGRVVALDGDRVLGPVIDAGPAPDDAVPVVVQLAKGVAPNRLALPPSHLGLDAQGRAVVVSDGVVIAVDVDGAVGVVAQDPRLDAPFVVEGGLVQRDGGTLLRVDLP